MDPTVIPAIGGTVGLLTAAGWLVISFMRENKTLRGEWKEQLKAVKSELVGLKAENVTCRIQVDGLISSLRQNGIDIPLHLIRGLPDAD